MTSIYRDNQTIVPIASLLDVEGLGAAAPFRNSIVLTTLAAALASYRRGNGGGSDDAKDDRWWLGIGVDVKYAEGAVHRHDMAGWRRDRVAKMPEDQPIAMRPDWVCDILNGTGRANVIRLRRSLHAAKVTHCWLVDLDEQVISVYRWHKDGYLALQDLQSGERAALEPFERLEIDANDLFGIE